MRCSNAGDVQTNRVTGTLSHKFIASPLLGIAATTSQQDVRRQPYLILRPQ